MAIRGQRFKLDLDADNFTFNSIHNTEAPVPSQPSLIQEIQEHDTDDTPSAPKAKQTKSGFPEHKFRRNVSAFKQRQEKSRGSENAPSPVPTTQLSDAAIRHQVASKYGYDPTAKEKAEISKENERRIAAMSEQDIEEARAEIMQTLSPALLQKMLRRVNIDENRSQEHPPETQGSDEDPGGTSIGASASQQNFDIDMTADYPGEEAEQAENPRPPPAMPSSSAVHFPLPIRDSSLYKPLDPSSPSFLTDLRTTYFPELTQTPSSLDWLQPSTTTSSNDDPSCYSPSLASYPASTLRFSFTGKFLPPNTSLSIPVHHGLHHHGDAPDSAGYTIPELTLLARSTMPNQRCISYQTIGRILYRLGTGEFGEPGSDLNEALWSVIEEERVLELIMAEANGKYAGGRGHVSAKAYATEALWLWRKGGGGERGLKKPREGRAK